MNEKKNQNEQTLNKLGKRLRLLREEQGWTISELSRRSGIPQRLLAQIEAGDDFDLDNLLRLCRVYDIEPGDLLNSL